MAIISNLLRIIAKPIILKLGKGLKSSKTKYCLGDEIDIRLDDSVAGKDNVIAKPPTRINSFSRWKDGVGKELTDSKTIQDDQGTTYTRSDQTSYLMHQIENTKEQSFFDAAYEAVVQSPDGNPIYRLIRRLKQTWTIFSEAADDSFRISGVSQQDATNRGDFLQIFPNGVIIGGNQARCAAKLTKTPNFAPHQYFELGANLPFQTIFDIDGTNNSAGLFYPGAGDGFNGAYYTTKYLNATYLIGCQFVLDITSDERIRYDFRIVYVDPANNILAEFPLNGIFPTSFISVNQTVRLTKESVVPNGRIKIRVKIFGGNPYINELSPGNKSYENYFGVHVLL